MIGMLTGRIAHRGADHVVIDVQGVGYIVHVSDRTLMALPGAGGVARLHTELLVREDLLQLFGFLTPAEKEWHRLLTSVQGVGAKAGMAILGALGPEGLARAIAIGDAAAIRRAPGVGPKLASRVAMELKDKAPAIMALAATATVATAPEVIEADTPAAPVAPPAAPATPASGGSAQVQAEALSALTNLGYGPSEAAEAVARAAETEAETPALIRAALRALAPKG
ncbi:Holliday junction branch migration protein RuvA [Pararhodobacter sp. SW119]|uniref:Holliday junction branch migration protein RuvA n=1 Tax=Pararhodobacter sp. SW119 TaxID=2780075 RepID=UPI001ADF2CD6|nr:Holliday junction branch migration protein RuvA [Pararhodobacter sp. SW119]